MILHHTALVGAHTLFHVNNTHRQIKPMYVTHTHHHMSTYRENIRISIIKLRHFYSTLLIHNGLIQEAMIFHGFFTLPQRRSIIDNCMTHIALFDTFFIICLLQFAIVFKLYILEYYRSSIVKPPCQYRSMLHHQKYSHTFQDNDEAKRITHANTNNLG